MAASKSQLKKKRLRALSRVTGKWNELRQCSREERELLMNQHSLTFHLDDVGAGWEYIHFELDHKPVGTFRVSYIGPDVASFIDELSSMKEEDSKEITFCDEPGEYSLIFARKKDLLYIELPFLKKGIWQEYSAFLRQVTEERKKAYGVS